MRVMLSWILRLAAMVAVLATASCAPTGTDELTSRANREYKEGNLDQAQADLHRVLAVEPSDPQALLTMGKIYHTQGQLEMALFYYQSAIDADPGNKQAQACLLQVQDELGRTGKALEIVPSPR